MIPTGKHVRLLLKCCLMIVAAGVVYSGLLGAHIVLQMSGTATISSESSYDCAMVFGAAVKRDGSPTDAVRRRVETATKLYRDDMVKTLHLSGGKGRGMETSEAAVMRNVALLNGVAPEDVFIEGESTSTEENLALSKPLLKECTTIVGVSDGYHLARIAYFANQLDFAHFDTLPTVEPTPRFFAAKMVIREVLAFSYTFLMQLRSEAL